MRKIKLQDAPKSYCWEQVRVIWKGHNYGSITPRENQIRSVYSTEITESFSQRRQKIWSDFMRYKQRTPDVKGNEKLNKKKKISTFSSFPRRSLIRIIFR